MRRIHLLLTGAAGALAFGAGLLLGDAGQDRATVALAPAGDPVPYVAARSGPPLLGDGTDPDAVAEAAAATDAAGQARAQASTPAFAPVLTGDDRPRPGTDGTSDDTGGDESTDSGGTDSDETAPAGRPVETVDDLLGTDRTSGDGTGEDADALRFTDPCAGDAPGAGGGEACPEGVGAAVLMDGDLPIPPPLALDDPWMGPMFLAGSEDRCPVGVDPDGTVHTIVLTNVPATVTLTLDVRGERHEVTAEPTVEERNRFTARLLDGDTVAGDQVHGVQTCLTFESLPQSLNAQELGGGRVVHWYQPAVHAVDDAGHEVSHEPGYLQMRVVDEHDALDPFADAIAKEGDHDPVELRLGAASFQGLPPGVRPRCPIGADGETLAGVVSASAPARLELAVIDRGRRTPAGTAEASADERRLHTELLASGDAPATVGVGAVQHCVELTGFHNPGRYYLDVTATDDAGSTVTGRLPFTITEAMAEGLPSTTAGRPQPLVVMRDGGEALVLVAFDSQVESVVAMGLERTGERATGEDCTAVEPTALRGAGAGRTVDISHPARPRPELFIPLPWDPPDERFDMVQPIRVTPGEGGVVDLCTWVITKPRGAFDPTVEERRSFHFEAPRRMRIALDLSYIHAASAPLIGDDHLLPIEANRYRITALNWPGQPSRSFPPAPNQGAYRWQSSCEDWDDWCDETRLTLVDSGERLIPEVTHLRITDTDGRSVETRIPTPNRCLLGRPIGVDGPTCSYGSPTHHWVDLPDNEGFLCIHDCNGRRFVELRVHPYEGPGGPPPARPAAVGDELVVQDSGSFDRASLELPRIPRADLTLDTPTLIPGVDGGRNGARLEVPFDRPVDVRVVPMLLEPIPESCDLPASQASPATAARHVFTFEDLCFGAHYQYTVHATDPEGGGTLRLPGPVFSLWSPGVPVRTVTVALEIAGEVPMRAGTLHAAFALGNADVVVRDAPGGCLDTHTWVEGEARTTSTAAHQLRVGDRTPFLMEITWTDCDGARHTLTAGRAMRLPEVRGGTFTYAASGDGLLAHATVTVEPVEPVEPMDPAG